MNWADFFHNLLTSQYPLATVVIIIVTIGTFFFVYRKPLMKYLLHEKLGIATKQNIADVQAELKKDVADIQAELKKNVAELNAKILSVKTDLKENDFVHSNKAMLIGFSLLLKKDQVQGFERIKDVILETTPDNKKDEIKAITL